MQRRSFVQLAAGFSILPAQAFARSAAPTEAEPALADRRTEQIKRIERYAKKGAFPRNVDFEGELVPYFIDDRGIPCAVAFLMIEDGKREDVERIAKASNHVRVMDVKEGPIVDWVLSSGVLQEEAARIQPTYGFEPDDPPKKKKAPKPVDPAIVERERIRRHLTAVVAELRATTDASLEIAEKRLREARVGG